MYTLWGNINAKWAAEKVLYQSAHVLIVEFNILRSDQLFEYLANYDKHDFHYVHKVDGKYNYIGKLEKSNIIRMNNGLVSFELIIYREYTSKFYECYTKNDICNMCGWKEINNQDKKYKIICN
jgi:hypothetical protein